MPTSALNARPETTDGYFFYRYDMRDAMDEIQKIE